MTDEEYMREAIELAERGRGWTAPNPVVGAVIVKEKHMRSAMRSQTAGRTRQERRSM